MAFSQPPKLTRHAKIIENGVCVDEIHQENYARSDNGGYRRMREWDKWLSNIQEDQNRSFLLIRYFKEGRANSLILNPYENGRFGVGRTFRWYLTND